MYFSFIVPVYNRPDEVDELLESLTKFTSNIPFEVVIIEDGSTIPCHSIIEKYSHKLTISYFLSLTLDLEILEILECKMQKAIILLF